MSIKFTDNENQEGREFEFSGYHTVQHGDYFINESGVIVRQGYNGVWEGFAMRAIVHLIPKPPITHDFGGIRFEETGEVRRVREGEWYLSTKGKVWPVHDLHQYDYIHNYIILKPITIIDQEEK